MSGTEAAAQGARRLGDAEQTRRCGEALGRRADVGGLVFLSGELGAGKTSLARGVLRGMGWREEVPSPTYALAHSYELATCPVFHLDLYRLESPAELEALGMEDCLPRDGDDARLCLIEWPERGLGALPPPELALELQIDGAERRLSWRWRGSRGEYLAAALEAAWA